MKIAISSQTDVGRERTNNEDAVTHCLDICALEWDKPSKQEYVQLGTLGAVSIVADGMGGANAGEVASELSINSLKKTFQDHAVLAGLKTEAEIHAFLASAIEKTNLTLLHHVNEVPESCGMGTTIVVAWLWQQQIHLAWCGDSRCYRFNPNCGLESLTKDHSYVQELIDRKEISEEEALSHPDAHLITRCLGDVDASSVPEVKTFNINDGDIFLLCSDGLCGYCSDRTIEKMLYHFYKEPDTCCQKLVNLALDYGGYDNITVSIVFTLPDRATEPPLSIRGKIRKWLHIY